MCRHQASFSMTVCWTYYITANQQVTCWLEYDHRSRLQRSVSSLQFLALASDVSCSSDIPICTNYNETSTSVFSTKKLKIALINLFWKLGFYGFKWILVKANHWASVVMVISCDGFKHLYFGILFCFFLVGCWLSQYFGWISVDVFFKFSQKLSFFKFFQRTKCVFLPADNWSWYRGSAIITPEKIHC